MTLIPIMIICLVVAVVLLIAGEYAGRKVWIYQFKPLASGLIVALIVASFFFNEVGTGYKLAMLFGMLFCFGGDIALMFDAPKAFIAGLLLFLCGHIIYAATLLTYGDYHWFDPIATPVIAVISVLIYLFLFSSLGSLKVPVLIYVLAITVMVDSALLTFHTSFFNTVQSWYLSIGAVLFYISDVMLAFNKFKIPFKHNRLSLAFYFAGQLLIALSTHYTALL